MGRRGVLAVVTVAIVPVLIVILSPFSGLRDVAHEATQLHLNLIGSSIYEYRAKTGRWPTQIEDLAKTSLPVKSPHWKKMLVDEVDVIVWHKDLKPEPKENGGDILVYHNKGRIAQRGQSWVLLGRPSH
jgi:hypothetical protein